VSQSFYDGEALEIRAEVYNREINVTQFEAEDVECVLIPIALSRLACAVVRKIMCVVG
jgi:hypothetical protein